MSEIKGTNVIAPVVPLSTSDTHPSHEALYGRGGYRTVATTTARDAIPAARREAGMLVFVTADSTIYRLGGDLTTWTGLQFGSVTVTAPLVNAGTSSAAELSLSVGSGLDVTDGTLVLTTTGAAAGDVLTFDGVEWTAEPPAFDGAYGSLSGLPTLGSAAAEDVTAFAAASHTHVASAIDSESAAAGYVLTADGEGGATWEEAGAAYDQSLNTGDDVAFHTAYLTNGDTQTYAYGTAQLAFGYADGGGYRQWITTTHNAGDADGNRIAFHTCDGTVDAAFPGDAILGLMIENGTVTFGAGGVRFADNTTQTTAWPGSLSYDDLDDLPSAFTPTSHTHAPSDVTFTATDRILGRFTTKGGAGEEITCTAAGRALLGDADASAQRTTLGLGTLATQSGTFSGTSSGTNTGDQTISLTGDVTGSGTGSFAATLANTAVTAGSYGSASSVATFTVDAKGRLTAAGSTAIAIASSAVSGLGGAATLNVGTSAGTVAAGDHTHSQLHDRSHAMTGTDHTAGNWRVFHSNGSGQVVELALGASGTVLTSGGTAAAPSFAALPAGGTKTVARFDALDNQPPASNFATLDTRNSIAVLDFDDATKESAVFAGVITESASLGSGLIIRLHWMATSATSNACRWEVSLERSNTDLDSDSFDTVATAATTTNGTSGIVSVTEITLTTIDSVTAGDLFRLRVARDAANAADTMTGDAELVAVEVRSAA